MSLGGRGGSPAGRRRRRAAAATAAVVAAGALALAGGASAGSPAVAQTELDLDVAIGVNGHAEPGDHAVARVRVTADVLVDGEIVARHRDGSAAVRQPLQVPAGTTKEVLVVVAVPIFGDAVTIEVREGGRVVASQDVRIRTGDDAELVGVLPRLLARAAELPNQVTLPSGTGRAELTPLGPDVLDLGPIALEAFDSVVGLAADVGDLDGAGRRALLLWVDAGGRLLLDDAAGADLDALPAAWRPGDAGYAWAGRGEVRLVDGAAGGDGWAELVEPSGSSSERLAFGAEVLAGPDQDLAARAGVELPSLVPVVLTLAVYGLVVGPVLYLVLRRARRLTLGWVAVPLVAVLVATGILVAGGRFRSSGNPAVATYVESSPAGALAVTNALVHRRAGGSVEVATPGGWYVDGPSPMFGTRDVAGEHVGRADGTAALALDLEPGQVAAATLSGPVPAPALTVTAELAGRGRVAGTVVNDTGVALRDVAVFVGERASSLGPLAPGEETTWEVGAPTSIARGGSRADQVWAGPFGERPGEQLAELGVWGTASLRWELFPTGMARVVGWTDTLPAPVDPGPGTSTRTAVGALAPIDPAGGPVGAATVRAVIVRSPFDPFGMGGSERPVVRYLLPPGSPTDRLELADLDRAEVTRVELWDGERWLAPAVEDGTMAVPAAAVRGGVVLARGPADAVGDASFVPVLRSVP